MRAVLVLSSVLLLLGVWAVCVWWLMERFWPQRWRQPPTPVLKPVRPREEFWDYQI